MVGHMSRPRDPPGRAQVDTSQHEKHAGAGHGWLHVVIGCGLMILGLLLLPVVDSTWGVVLVLVELALSPVVMLLVMWHMQAPSSPVGLRRRGCQEDRT